MTSKLLGRICLEKKTKIFEKRPLTSIEYENYKKARKTLSHFNKNLTLFKMVYHNFRNYEGTLNDYSREFADNPTMDEGRMDVIYLELNRHISNYLSSVRLFLDHSEYTLKSKYGKDSLILKEFEETCSNAYDKNFSYRFLYKLRNFVQHCGMPISCISFGSGLIDNDLNKAHNHFELQLIRDSLLEGFNWKKLEPEIKALPPKFDINPHIISMNKSIGDITFTLIKNELSDSIICSEYLKRLISEAMVNGNSQCTPCIIDSKNVTSSCGGKLRVRWFPVHIIKLVDYFTNDASIKL